MKPIYTLMVICIVISGRAQNTEPLAGLAFDATITFSPDEFSFKPELDEYLFEPHITQMPAFMFNDNLPVHLESGYLLGYVTPPPLVLPEVSAEMAIPRKDFKLNTLLLSSGLMLTSGFCDGTSEVLKIKYERFKNVFPGSNDQFWDYNISWTNKYKEGNPPEARFLGSKSLLVWTTDGYHLMRMMRNATMIAAMTIPIKGGIYKNWRYYLLEGIIYYVSYTAGFNLAYDVVFE